MRGPGQEYAMSKILVPIILAAGLVLPFHAFAKSAGDCPASNSDMMRHFGRSLLKADGVLIRGESDPAGVSDDDIKAAIAGIESGISCGSLVFDDCNLELLPPRLREEPALFRQHMQNFVDALTVYKNMFAAQLLLPPSERNFSEIAKQKRVVLDVVNEAHRDL